MSPSDPINMALARSKVGMQSQAWVAAMTTADASWKLGQGKSTCRPGNTEGWFDADLQASAGYQTMGMAATQ